MQTLFQEQKKKIRKFPSIKQTIVRDCARAPDHLYKQPHWNICHSRRDLHVNIMPFCAPTIKVRIAGLAAGPVYSL